MTLWTPPGTRSQTGRSVFPPPDVLTLKGGALLKHASEWIPGPDGKPWAKMYRGPHELMVLVSMDDRGEPWGELLHMTLSLPRGYPDWDLIYAVTRAVFGDHVDAMMPIPREEAYIHGMTAAQKSGRVRQVFHVVEMPQSWPREG